MHSQIEGRAATMHASGWPCQDSAQGYPEDRIHYAQQSPVIQRHHAKLLLYAFDVLCVHVRSISMTGVMMMLGNPGGEAAFACGSIASR